MATLSFDPIVTNPGRLCILTALSRDPESSQEFVQLRRATRLTDGNLATHARRLESAGLISIDKQPRAAGRVVTTIHLTQRGREALRSHVEQVTEALGSVGQRVTESQPTSRRNGMWSEDWVD